MEDRNQIIFFSIGAVMMTFIAIAIIAFVLYYGNRVRLKKIAEAMLAKQTEKEMYDALVQTQENEKLRLARNLHDEVKPILATIKNKLQGYQLVYKDNRSEILDYADTIALINQTYEIIQNTTYDLAPSFLIYDGIFHALQFQLIQANNFSFKVNYYECLSEESKNYFSHNQRLHIYRVVLEVFNNIIKHDNPNSVTVNVEEENETIVFLLTHNGKGIDDVAISELKKTSHRIGLKSIHARIELLNGTINYFKEPDFSGVKLTIPF